MRMIDVSDEYVECSDCQVVVVAHKIRNTLQSIDESKFFQKEKRELYGHVDYQCPKCFKVWRQQFKKYKE